MPALLIFFVLVHALLHAKEDASLLEKMVQPKVSVDATRLSKAEVGGYGAYARTGKYGIKLNNAFGAIAYSRWDFTWDGEENLPFYRGKVPIEHLHQFKASGNLFKRLSDRWVMLASLNASATYEKELDVSAVAAGAFGFFSYSFDRDHAIQTGAFVNYHPVTTLALPVIGYSYRARADDGFTMVLGFPRAYAGYHIAPGVLLRAGFIFSQAVIRLADDSGIEPAGYMEASDYQSSAGVRYTLDKRWELSADVLYAFRREIRTYDHAANILDTYRIAPSAGMMFKLIYRFN